MAIDCSNVPNNVTYDCGNPWGQGCTSDKHFNFASLWNYTENIQKACANDSRLFLPNGGNASPHNASLTQASCAAIAGYDWTYYPAADIWTRLTTWKFPLLQLVASFPRPPLDFWVECFVILHLLGDPLDTMKNLLAKMSSCHDTAKDWRAKCERLLDKPPGEDEDRDWKAMALITDAYGEWNEDEEAKKALHLGLYVYSTHDFRSSNAKHTTGWTTHNVKKTSHQQFAERAAHSRQIGPQNFCPSLLPNFSSSERSGLPFSEPHPRPVRALPATASSST